MMLMMIFWIVLQASYIPKRAALRGVGGPFSNTQPTSVLDGCDSGDFGLADILVHDGRQLVVVVSRIGKRMPKWAEIVSDSSLAVNVWRS